MGTLSVRYTERLVMRFGARTCLFPGLAMIAAALLYFTRVPVDGNYFRDVFPVMVLLGAGAGTCFPSLMTLAMSGATPSDAGLASGLVNTGAQAGGALGLAILATISSSRTDHLLAQGTSQAAALTGGYHVAFWIAAGLIVASLLVAVFVVEAPEKAAAHVAADPEMGCAEAA
jgi:MFS family permease